MASSCGKEYDDGSAFRGSDFEASSADGGGGGGTLPPGGGGGGGASSHFVVSSDVKDCEKNETNGDGGTAKFVLFCEESNCGCVFDPPAPIFNSWI
jgi:hypothetical protein